MYKDKNGTELKEGDKITLELVGLGIGKAEVKKDTDGTLCIYENSQGYLPLSDAMISDGIILTKIY
tara:strand:+ start:1697 stop:1894 length:198 start_codon:yes stop_codon:yes gene_type:complete